MDSLLFGHFLKKRRENGWNVWMESKSFWKRIKMYNLLSPSPIPCYTRMHSWSLVFHQNSGPRVPNFDLIMLHLGDGWRLMAGLMQPYAKIALGQEASWKDCSVSFYSPPTPPVIVFAVMGVLQITSFAAIRWTPFLMKGVDTCATKKQWSTASKVLSRGRGAG